MKTAPEPHPATQVLSGLEAMVESVVHRVLQQRGAFESPLGPRALRIAKGFTIDAVSQLSGISKPTVSRIECGETRNPEIDTLNRIAAAMGIPANEYRESVARLIQNLPD